MKFTLVASTLGLAALALAAPAEIEVRGGSSWGGSGGKTPPSSTSNSNNQNNCGQSQTPVCCEGGSCYVSSASGSVTCSNTQSQTLKCCQTNAAPGALINIQALDCNDVEIPISIPVGLGK
ncbi:unnamed protein product [Clonostachys rosea]|uniref:Hydrophobin n=1 Tax=Bionectria ochroleuca TaxID=29856 RepID=A0ABY6UT79_BIOOC|nr:unnamed protein product [Clonostachys rosea]